MAWVFRFGCFGGVDFGDLQLQVFRRAQSLEFRVRVWGLSTVFDGITCQKTMEPLPKLLNVGPK